MRGSDCLPRSSFLRSAIAGTSILIGSAANDTHQAAAQTMENPNTTVTNTRTEKPYVTSEEWMDRSLPKKELQQLEALQQDLESPYPIVREQTRKKIFDLGRSIVHQNPYAADEVQQSLLYDGNDLTRGSMLFTLRRELDAETPTTKLCPQEGVLRYRVIKDLEHLTGHGISCPDLSTLMDIKRGRNTLPQVLQQIAEETGTTLIVHPQEKHSILFTKMEDAETIHIDSNMLVSCIQTAEGKMFVASALHSDATLTNLELLRYPEEESFDCQLQNAQSLEGMKYCSCESGGSCDCMNCTGSALAPKTDAKDMRDPRTGRKVQPWCGTSHINFADQLRGRRPVAPVEFMVAGGTSFLSYELPLSGEESDRGRWLQFGSYNAAVEKTELENGQWKISTYIASNLSVRWSDTSFQEDRLLVGPALACSITEVLGKNGSVLAPSPQSAHARRRWLERTFIVDEEPLSLTLRVPSDPILTLVQYGQEENEKAANIQER